MCLLLNQGRSVTVNNILDNTFTLMDRATVITYLLENLSELLLVSTKKYCL